MENSNINPNTVISNASTQDPSEQDINQNNRYRTNDETHLGCNSATTSNSNISENSIHASAPNSISVTLPNADEYSKENVNNSNTSISSEIPDECIDIDEFMLFDFESYLDINIITKIPTVDGNASRFGDNNKSVIENNGLPDLEEVDNKNSCSGNFCEDTKNISLSDVSDFFKGIDNLKCSSADIDDVKIFTNKFKQETNNEVKNEYPFIDSENKEIINSFDIISVSSGEECTLMEEATKVIKNTLHQNSGDLFMSDTNWDSDCSGYHSSDFEFITESEAKLEGLIKTVGKNRQTTLSLMNNSESGPSTSKCFPEPCHGTDNGVPIKKDFNYYDLVPENQPSESNNDKKISSRINVNFRNSNNYRDNPPTTSSLAKANSSNLRNNFLRDRYRAGLSYSNNIALNNHPLHNAIPDGEQYFDLFRGIYAPDMPLSAIYMMENKSVRTTIMNVEFEGIGFDMRLMRNFDDSSQEEYEDEAQASVEKILSMYPGENRKRRRRH